MCDIIPSRCIYVIPVCVQARKLSAISSPMNIHGRYGSNGTSIKNSDRAKKNPAATYAVWYGLSNTAPFLRQSRPELMRIIPCLVRSALVNSHVHNRDPRDSEFTMGNGSSISNPGG